MRVDIKQGPFAPIIHSVTHIKGCARPAHTNKHQMPAIHSKSTTAEQQEREARNKALEAARQKKIKHNITVEITCPACSFLYTDSQEHTPYVLLCGHSVCRQCVDVNLPTMYKGIKKPLTCPCCRKTFPGETYVATRNYALMAVAELLSDAENPNKRVGAGDMSPEPEDVAASGASPGRNDRARADTLEYRPSASPWPEDGAPTPFVANRSVTVQYEQSAQEGEERDVTLEYVPPDARAATPYVPPDARAATPYVPGDHRAPTLPYGDVGDAPTTPSTTREVARTPRTPSRTRGVARMATSSTSGVGRRLHPYQ